MMRTKWAAIGIASVVLVACQTGTMPTSTPPTAKLSSSVDRLSIDQGRATYQKLAAQGMVYSIVGRVAAIEVSTVDGHAHVAASAVSGEPVQVTFVKGAHNIFNLDRIGQRGTRIAVSPVECADCEGSGGGSTPPRPQQTRPPNYDSCQRAGGATWFNEANGDGGCLGPGSSRGFPCGIWSYSSPGRGRFRSWDGSVDYSGFEFISSNADGVNCTLGPLG